MFIDHLGNLPPNHSLPDVVELEWKAGRRDPYRSAAHLTHLTGQW